MGFLEDLEKKYNAKFVSASPLRVDFFTHDLETDSDSNSKAAHDLLAGKHTLITKIPEGDLLLCKDGIILLTSDTEFPIKFFCAWKYFLVAKKSAIQSKFVWCDTNYRKVRIDGKPLAAYCLFNILLPKYKIVVSGDEHTPDGERLEKNQTKHAIPKGIFVYVKDENHQIFKIEDPNIVVDDADAFWGHSPEYKDRLFIYSTKEIF
jgi:hypothetical protein